MVLNRFGRTWLLPVTLLLLAGCGPSGPAMYPVSGKVTFNGETLPDGYVTFTSKDRSTRDAAGPIVDGEYSFEAEAGEYDVRVESSQYVDTPNPVMGMNPKVNIIPEKYNDQTTLTATVTPDGNNTFDFPLTDK